MDQAFTIPAVGPWLKGTAKLGEVRAYRGSVRGCHWYRLYYRWGLWGSMRHYFVWKFLLAPPILCPHQPLAQLLLLTYIILFPKQVDFWTGSVTVQQSSSLLHIEINLFCIEVLKFLSCSLAQWGKVNLYMINQTLSYFLSRGFLPLPFNKHTWSVFSYLKIGATVGSSELPVRKGTNRA